MNLQPKKYYIDRKGRVHGPLEYFATDDFPYVARGLAWTWDGKFNALHYHRHKPVDHPFDLVGEVRVERV